MRTRKCLGLAVSGLALTVSGVLTVGLAGQPGQAAATQKPVTKHRSHGHHDDCKGGAGKGQDLDWNADWGRDWGNDGDQHFDRSFGDRGHGDRGHGDGGDWSRDFDSDNTKPKCPSVAVARTHPHR